LTRNWLAKFHKNQERFHETFHHSFFTGCDCPRGMSKQARRGCRSNSDRDGGSYTRVRPDELKAMLKGKDFVFINVHIPFEGNIACTDLSLPYKEITDPANLVQLPADRNAKIVLYCRSGRMSQIAAEALVSLGYTNIWDLAGGMVEWEQAGFDLEN
jgi:phage shock protein E